MSAPATESSPQKPARAIYHDGPDFLVADLRAAEAFSSARKALEERIEREGQSLHPRPELISQPQVVGAMLLFDALNFLASGALAYLSIAVPVHLNDKLLATGLLFVTAVGLICLSARWAYTIPALTAAGRQIAIFCASFIAALTAWTAFCVLAGMGEPTELRQWAIRWFVLGCGFGALARLAFAGALTLWRRQGKLARRTVIVGGGEQDLLTIQRLEQSGKGALQILGVFDDRDRSRAPADLGRYRKLGAFDDLERFCREQKVDLLILAFPRHAEARILHVLRKLWTLPLDVRILALDDKLRLRSRCYNYIGDVPFLPVFDKPLSDWSVALKSIEDWLLAFVLVACLSPLLALIALGVKLTSRGPVLFRQTRYGFNNESFEVLKFRSMYAHLCDPAVKQMVTRGDPRVTPFGAFLRRTSLDELPQLFNVLRGELALVGPRPHVPKGKAAGIAYEQVVDGYFARHKVRPGITGWAQINGWRGETDTVEKIEQRVAHDLHYIENWSPWLDLKILLLTPLAVIGAKNAF